MANVLANGSSFSFPALWLVGFLPVCLGFINPVYSFSVGYGYSIALMSASLLLAAHGVNGLTLPVWLHLYGGLAYGLRLGTFLYYRSIKWADWGKRASNAPEAKPMSAPQRAGMFVGIALFYACMSCPMMWHLQHPEPAFSAFSLVGYLGLALQWTGLIIEGVADQQKFNFKAAPGNEGKWCEEGLFATSRHPNYLGEIMFWLGTSVAGFPSMAMASTTVASTVGIWVPPALGVLGITSLMIRVSGTLDQKQESKYGENDEYKQYVERSGRLLPKL